MCANSLYVGGPETLLTDQHLLRTNFFFVTETSDLRLAGLLLPSITFCLLPSTLKLSPTTSANSQSCSLCFSVRGGHIRVLSFKVGVILMCKAHLEDKYRCESHVSHIACD